MVGSRNCRGRHCLLTFLQATATSSNLALHHRGRQIVTRYQERQIRKTFPLLKLPAELRNIIYEYAINILAAQKIIDRYYQALRETKNIKSVQAPLIWSKCPTIFLLNRQVYAEASFLIRKRNLTFDHGLLDLLTIKDFVPDSLIRNVSSITVDDSGHPLFKDNILAASWMGYITLIEQLANVLKDGHRLKQFTISLANEELGPHVTTCWHATYACGFRDSLRRAAETLRAVRNVGNATLVGFPEPLASQLKARMESAPTSFLNLPRELRDIIYADALDWSDVSQSLVRTLANWVDKSVKSTAPTTSTPTVLLLNRQITSEALTVLHSKPLTMVFPADHSISRRCRMPDMLDYITRGTLQHVQTLVLRLESWEWIHSIDHLLPLLASTSAHPSYPVIRGHFNKLKAIHFYFKDDLKVRFLVDVGQSYPDHSLHLTLSGLTKIRGLKTVTFAGDLPACYTAPLAHIMCTPASFGNGGLPRLMAIKGTGEVVSPDGDE